jgi:hypothetical protein
MDKIIKNFKNYLNENFKLIGYELKNHKTSFNACNDDVIIFKFLCDNSDDYNTPKERKCKCERLEEIFKSFSMRYGNFIESGKFSLNGHITYHEFKMYVE